MEQLIGKTIKIICMTGKPNYAGKIGVVIRTDDMGQLHVT